MNKADVIIFVISDVKELLNFLKTYR